MGEFSTVMQTLDFVSGLHNCLEFSQPLECLYQAMQTRKTFSIPKIRQAVPSDALRHQSRGSASKFLLYPVILLATFGIPHPMHTFNLESRPNFAFNPESQPRNKANPRSRNTCLTLVRAHLYGIVIRPLYTDKLCSGALYC